MPFPTPELAATLDARQSPLHRSLDGAWEFRLAARPEEAAAALRRARGWDTVDVPSLWTMQGYDRPHYTNVVMPFDEPPPHVPEQNPTGIYRRSFSVPRGWRRRRIVLGFGGVEGALYVLLNGTPVGISKDARTPAEFDVTEVVRRDGPNELVAVVVRWSDASFIEDQDQWWHAGLSREVYLYATGATYDRRRLRPRRPRRRPARRPPHRGGLDRRPGRGRRARSPPARPEGNGDREGVVCRDARADRDLAPPVVRRGSRAVHARRQPRWQNERERRLPRRLSPRRDSRRPAARERQGRADPRGQPPRSRRHARACGRPRS